MKQDDLFGPYGGDLFGPYGGEPPSVRHSETSQAAASGIKKQVGPLHRRLLAHLEGVSGATDEEMQRDLPMGANTQRPRRRELELMGRIVDSGGRRLTQSRRQAVVWRIVRA